jgi:hypothetical protein
MRLVRRVAIVVVCGFALWIVALAILGAVVGGREQQKTSERLAKSLQAKVTIGASDLALIRGRLTLDNLAIRRDESSAISGSTSAMCAASSLRSGARCSIPIVAS